MRRARLLAVLLLSSLAWGTTAEFTHHHGHVRPGEALIGLAQSSAFAQSTANQIESSDQNGPASNSKKKAECLICQLHQTLSSTVIGHTPGIEPTDTGRINAPVAEVFELPAFTSCGHGRAPPSIV